MHDSDVIIVGCGPTGKLLAILLGRKGYRVTIVERHLRPYSLPRAVAFDDEAARILAEIGIDADNDPDIEYFDEWYFLRNGAGVKIAAFDWRGQTPLGWRCHYWFNQPTLEAKLAKLIEELPTVTLLLGLEAKTIHQTYDWVELTGERMDESGSVAPTSIKGKFLVGADGANSLVRQEAGLPIRDLGFHYDWLIVDVIPHAPMTFESPILQVCDPARPTTLMPGGRGRRRWEFMVLPDEDPRQMNSEQASWTLLAKWGVTPETAVLERHVVWRFEARWADEWRNGRIVIAGDAAHLMPPFAGQGMCAGLRDAAGLAWRFDLILRKAAGAVLLQSYGQERREHVRYFEDFSIDIGKAVCVLDPIHAAKRDLEMQLIMNNPSLGSPPVPYPSLGVGVWAVGNPGAGHISRQGKVRTAGREGRLDQVFGDHWLLLGFDVGLESLLTKEQAHQFSRIHGRLLNLGPPGSRAHVEDLDRVYRSWFDELGVDAMLIRPDRYVAVAAAAADFGASFAAVMNQMHLTV